MGVPEGLRGASGRLRGVPGDLTVFQGVSGITWRSQERNRGLQEVSGALQEVWEAFQKLSGTCYVVLGSFRGVPGDLRSV